MPIRILICILTFCLIFAQLLHADTGTDPSFELEMKAQKAFVEWLTNTQKRTATKHSTVSVKFSGNWSITLTTP